jgi:hypothetical protein
MLMGDVFWARANTWCKYVFTIRPFASRPDDGSTGNQGDGERRGCRSLSAAVGTCQRRPVELLRGARGRQSSRTTHDGARLRPSEPPVSGSRGRRAGRRSSVAGGLSSAAGGGWVAGQNEGKMHHCCWRGEFTGHQSFYYVQPKLANAYCFWVVFVSKTRWVLKQFFLRASENLFPWVGLKFLFPVFLHIDSFRSSGMKLCFPWFQTPKRDSFAPETRSFKIRVKILQLINCPMHLHIILGRLNI